MSAITKNDEIFPPNIKNYNSAIQKNSDMGSMQNNNTHLEDDSFTDSFKSKRNNNVSSTATIAQTTKAFATDSKFYGKPLTDTPDFFATFNDNFNKNKTDTSTFDAFGEIDNKVSNIITTTNKPSTSKFESDNFKDEFGRIKNDPFDVFNDMRVNSSSKSFEDSFSESSDTFDRLNNPKEGKIVFESAFDLKNDRFAADYSKGETFAEDLNEILKRSLVDQ